MSDRHQPPRCPTCGLPVGEDYGDPHECPQGFRAGEVGDNRTPSQRRLDGYTQEQHLEKLGAARKRIEARRFPEWCLLCASMAHDNSCGHFPGPMPSGGK